MIDDKKLQNKLGFYPHPKQRELLDAYNLGKRKLVLCAGTRSGKSAICGYLALKMLLEPNKKIWIVAPTYALAEKVFEYVVRWFLKVAPSQAAGVTFSPNSRRIKTAEGSLLEAKSAETPQGLLGEELDLIIVDEASRVGREVWNSYLFARTASRKGQVVFISTPFGKNWFYEEWVKGKEDNASFHFESRDNPTLPKGEWERAERELPENVFKQEYRAEFLEDAAAALRRVHDAVDPKLELPVLPRMGVRYIMGVDLGRVKDFTVLTVVDTYEQKVCFWDRFKEIDWPLQKSRIIALGERYNKATIWIDSTGLGDPISQEIQREYRGLVEDFKMSTKSKNQLITKLASFIEQKGVVLPDNRILLDELTSYSYELTPSGKISYRAPEGLHDDCVMSLALAVWGLDTPERKKDHQNFRDSRPRKIQYQFV